jgi:putative membrane protein
VPDPVALLVVTVPGAAYLVGLHRVWAGAGPARVVHPRQAAAYLVGLAVVALALASPLDGAAAGSLTAHMVQHVLLVGVAAPLLAAGAPLPTLLWALPATWRRRVTPRWRRVATHTAGRRWASWTAAALVVHVVVLWVWHVPALYQATAADRAVHALEHVTFLASAVAFWWTVGWARRRSASGAGLLALFAATLSGTGLGALMTLAGQPWYPTYVDAGKSAALEDQQVAGVVMWGFGGVAAVVAAVALFASWLAAAERATPSRAGQQ